MSGLGAVSVYRLAEMYCQGELTADEYYAELDRRAPLMVEQMIRDERGDGEWRSWIDMEPVRDGPGWALIVGLPVVVLMVVALVVFLVVAW